MSIIGDLLFWSRMDQAGLSDVLRHNIEKVVPASVAAVPEAVLKRSEEEALVDELVRKGRVKPLELHLDKAEGDVREKRVEVRDVFGDVAAVAGLRVSKVIPFSGDEGLFRLRPDTWGMNPPRGEVTRGRLVVGMEVRESAAEEAMSFIDHTVAQVQECIGYQRPSIDAYNERIHGIVVEAVRRRRESLGKASDLAARLRGR